MRIPPIIFVSFLSQVYSNENSFACLGQPVAVRDQIKHDQTGASRFGGGTTLNRPNGAAPAEQTKETSAADFEPFLPIQGNSRTLTSRNSPQEVTRRLRGRIFTIVGLTLDAIATTNHRHQRGTHHA
jgi:hypothetical protein